MQINPQGSGASNMIRNLSLNTEVKLKMLDTSGFNVRRFTGQQPSGGAPAAPQSVPALQKGASAVKINLLV